MTTRWVYDLDGTLVETRQANLAAYGEVGVTPPADFAVRPWQEWCSPGHHERKNDVLPRMLARYASYLPAYHLLTTTGGMILTNASERTYAAIVAVFPSIGQYGVRTGVTPDEKLVWLKAEAERMTCGGVYLDDNSELVARVRRETSWQALDTSGF